MSEPEKCLYPGCQNAAETRGLCINHYQIAGRLVRQGVVTWDRLIANGKAKEAARLGLRKNEWFLEGLKP